MANVGKAAIVINSEVLTESQLEEKRQKVKKWQDYGYSIMAILHFLSQEVHSVSGSLEGENFIVVLG